MPLASTRQANGLGELPGMGANRARVRWTIAVALYAAMLLASFGAASSRGNTSMPRTEQRCTYAQFAARCGSIGVWENRALHGRRIALRYVVVPANGPQHGPPVFVIAGGPGQSAVDVGKELADDPFVVDLHERHDFVFIDQRGTGRSNPLACNLYPNPSDALGALFPAEAVRACKTRLAKHADLDMYGSETAADDLDEARRALGYAKIDVFGGSYGSTESLVYLRKYGASVNAMLLEGVAPPWFSLPLPFAQSAQHALDDLIAACDADLPCRTHFPNFNAQFASLLQSSAGGIPVSYVDSRTNQRVSGVLSREVFADRMRQVLYSPDTAALVPMIVDRAYHHDTTPLGKLAVWIAQNMTGQLAIGENLSVTCSEDVPFITAAAIVQASRDSFLSDTRVRAQQRACAIWNVRPVSRAFLDPVRSSVPVLMLSGADDPATPPQYGAQESRYLSNGRQLVIPNGGHNNDDPCLTSVEIEFLETASVANLDASCVRHFVRPAFVYTMPSLFAD